jgi:large subunit ribosomal protein L13Ae
MVPHKTARGAAALERLKVFEGIPAPYDKMKRMVVPGALTVNRIRPGRDTCTVGRLSAEVGWKYQTVVERLEDKRRVRSEAYYQRKKALLRVRSKATAVAAKKTAADNKVLAGFGL